VDVERSIIGKSPACRNRMGGAGGDLTGRNLRPIERRETPAGAR
jgi:hypothetical protein